MSCQPVPSFRILIFITYLLLSFSSFHLLIPTHACGPVVHSLITHRAQQRLLRLLLRNNDMPPTPLYSQSVIDSKYSALFANHDNPYIHTLISGSSFPDYLYHCASDHEAGEVAHWSVFQVESIIYIHERYGDIFKKKLSLNQSITSASGDNDQTKFFNLLSFMLGIVSHSQSDIEWHGLYGNVATFPRAYGLIQYICAIDYDYTDGSLCDEGHTIADFGGEFVAAVNTNLSKQWFQPDQWTVPVDDIISIYQRLNHTVTSTTLELCRVQFIGLALAVQEFAPLLYHRVTDPSPTLVERFLDLSTGGIDDMSIQVIEAWKRYLQWLDDGIPEVLPDSWKPNTKHKIVMHHQQRKLPVLQQEQENHQLHLEEREKRRRKHHQHKAALYRRLMKLSQPIMDSYEWKQYVNGDIDYHTLRQSIRSSQYYDTIRIMNEGVVNKHQHHAAVKRHVSVSEHESKRRFMSLATTPLEAHNQSYDIQYVYTINNTDVTLLSSPTGIDNQTESFARSNEYNYYGSSISTGNVDGQGVAQFVCSYGSALQNGGCQSQVYRNDTTILSLYINMDVFARFGYAQVHVDIDLDGYDDWVVASPFASNWTHAVYNETEVEYKYYGGVHIFYGDNDFFTSHTPHRYAYNQSTELIQQYATVLISADVNGDGHNDLIIGSPYSRNIQTSRSSINVSDTFAAYRGRIDISLASSNNQHGIHHDITIISDDNYSTFGHSAVTILFNDNNTNPYTLLLVSSPTYKFNGSTSVGRIAAYCIDNSTRGKLNYSDTVFTIIGDVNDAHSKFGYTMSYSTKHQLLAVGAISAANGNANDSQHNGKVYLISNVHQLRGDVFINNTDLRATLVHPSSGARFGWNIQVMDIQHIIPASSVESSLSIPNTPPEHVLLISAPLYSISYNDTQHGSVLVYRNIDGLRGININAVTSASYVKIGTSENGRFGSTLALEEKPDMSILKVGTPYASVPVWSSMYGMEVIDMMGDVQSMVFTNMVQSMFL